MLQGHNEQQWELVRGFSGLGRLQSESLVCYGCARQPGGAYQFTMRRQCGGHTRQESAMLEGISSIQAQQITQYLYENAVPIENWRDVLQELRELL